MSSDIAIKVENLSKCYQIYDHPRDRLKQFVLPRLQKLVGKSPKQYYREFWALKDVSFEVKKGETVGIIGRNGSGKSTLLQTISGTVSPTTGVINTRGRLAALLELGAGFNTEFTGRENVFLHAAILGVPREEIEARINDILAFSELGEFFEQPVKLYSSGMFARLAFSAAINVNPEILIIDEALAVGDSRFVAKCMRRIKDIQQLGTTILFVSHDVGSVRALCKRALWLDNGQLIEEGDVFLVTGQYMEYLFKDEEIEEKPLREKAALQQQAASPESSNLMTVTQTDSAPVTHSETEINNIVINAKPVTHWGSHKGIIRSAAIYDKRGVCKDMYMWGEEINIVIEVHVPKDILREDLSVAFSIKDLKGTDLIVSTTHDFKCGCLPCEEHFSVSFRLVNQLVTGNYLLVAAVENRRYRDIHYYEYIEGAQYFSSFANERLFGIFHPAIEQAIEVQRTQQCLIRQA